MTSTKCAKPEGIRKLTTRAPACVRKIDHARSTGVHTFLQEIDVVAKSESTKGGRKITSNGQRDLDLIAGRIVPKGGAEEPEEEEEE